VSDNASLRGVVIRPATVADIPDLVRLRRMMFESMGWNDPTQVDASISASEAYLIEAIPAGTFRGWVAVASSGEVVSTGGVIVDRHIPTPKNLSGQVGYILNVATDPEYRRRGLARRIMQAVLDWLAACGVQKIALHTSDAGQHLYASLGFEPSNEMRLYFEET
jgi:ribosomal protein S18 acetylase RimI-like enzyme